MFGRDMWLTLSYGSLDFLLIKPSIDQHNRYPAEQYSNSNGHKYQSILTCVEMVDLGEGVRKRREEGEDDAKRVGRVEAEESDNGFAYQHVQWPEEGNHEDEFGFGQARRPSRFWRCDAQTLCAVLQDGLFVRLLHSNRHNQREGTEKQDAPLRPAPSFVLCCKAADDWPVKHLC